MDEALMKELENLRAENKILRDSLVEDLPEDPEEGNGPADRILQETLTFFNKTLDLAKERLGPGAQQLTDTLSRQMEENPIPMLLAAFGAGYLLSGRRERR